MSKSPLALVKDKFGDKKSLVSAVEKFTSEDLWVGRTNADKGLAHVSNSKLLRLVSIFTEVKEKFTTRAGLIDAIAELDKRAKDDGYKAHLGKFPVPRLYDLYKATSKRVKASDPNKVVVKRDRAAEAAKKIEIAKKAAVKKAAAKPIQTAAQKKSALKKAAAKR